MSFPWLLSMMVGFLSLSQEILWVRLCGFAFGGRPFAFAFVLTCYLFGIALGAAAGRRLCDRSTDLYAVAAFTLLAAALTDPLPPVVMTAFPVGLKEQLADTVIVAAAIVLTAAIKSVLFPIAHHLGAAASGPRLGRAVSNIYFGNIVGSTLGPIVTGFFLLDVLNVDACFRVVACLSLALAMLCALRAETRAAVRAAVGLGLCAAALLLWLPASHFVRQTGARQETPQEGPGRITNVIENKHGIIHTVERPGRDDDVVYGGNAYDGRVSTSIRQDTGIVSRAYLLAALHPAPRRILVVGLSAGAWTRVLSGFAGLERLDAVEINGGYLELIRRYPLVAPLLDDPRVAVHIDDGRRWLKRHPDARYDLIVMNTTLHWRANATNLLSREFLSEAGGHLSPGGLLAFNITHSLDALKTAAAVFPFVSHFASFAYCSNNSFGIDPAAGRARLLGMRIGGQPVFADRDFAPGAVGDQLLHVRLEPAAAVLARSQVPAGVITDGNMLSEYRHGRRANVFKALLPPPEDVLLKEP